MFSVSIFFLQRCDLLDFYSSHAVNACFLQSNQIRDNIHLWQFACSRKVCALVWEIVSTLYTDVTISVSYNFSFTSANASFYLFGSTAFLIGPKRQVVMMLDPVRIYATAIFTASIIIALFCALYVSSHMQIEGFFPRIHFKMTRNVGCTYTKS